MSSSDLTAQALSYSTKPEYTFIACVLEAILYGVAMSLAIGYIRFYSRNINSSRYLRAEKLIWIIIICTSSSVHFFSLMIYAYNIFVVNFTKPGSNNTITIPAGIQLIALYFVIVSTQMFYINKIWKSTRNILLVAPACILSLIGFGAGLAQAIRGVAKIHSFLYLSETNKTYILASSAIMACDLFISCILCYDLQHQRSGFRNIDELLSKMAFYSINCGVATSITALANLVLFHLYTNTFKFQIPLFAGVQLYVLSAISMSTIEIALESTIKKSNKSIFLHHLGRIDRETTVNTEQPAVCNELNSGKTWDITQNNIETPANTANSEGLELKRL